MTGSGPRESRACDTGHFLELFPPPPCLTAFIAKAVPPAPFPKQGHLEHGSEVTGSVGGRRTLLVAGFSGLAVLLAVGQGLAKSFYEVLWAT